MQPLKKFVIPFFVIILTCVLMNVLRVLPVSKFMKGYESLYVEKSCSLKTVENLLKENGCASFLNLKNQKVPLNTREDSPEIALALSGLEKSDYLNQRKSFFYDKSMNYNIFYIPSDCVKAAEKTVDRLTSEGIICGLNANASFPILLVLVVFVLSAIFVAFSDDRIFSAIMYLLPVFYTLMIPFTLVASSMCLLETGIFLALKFTGRKGAYQKLVKTLIVPVFLGTAFAAVCFTKFQAVIVFLLLCASEISVYILHNSINEFLDRRYSFRPVKIRTAAVIPLFTQKNKNTLLVCIASISLLLAGAFINFPHAGRAGNVKSILLPSSQAAVSSLPDFNDFIFWKWEAMTFPYISLNSKSKQSDEVVFKKYSKKDGFISESLNYISYNKDFRNDAIKEIENVNYPSLEKMILQQGTKVRFGYSASGAQNLTMIMMIMLLITLAVPVYFYFRFQKRR